MTFLDTEFFVASLNRRDSLHERSLLWARRLKGTFLTTEYVLWEVANFLCTAASRSKAVETIQLVRRSHQYRLVPATQKLADEALDLYRRMTDKHWSLTDCASFIVMREMRVSRALTHDHHFEQAGFEALLKADPLDDD